MWRWWCLSFFIFFAFAFLVFVMVPRLPHARRVISPRPALPRTNRTTMPKAMLKAMLKASSQSLSSRHISSPGTLGLCSDSTPGQGTDFQVQHVCINPCSDKNLNVRPVKQCETMWNMESFTFFTLQERHSNTLANMIQKKSGSWHKAGRASYNAAALDTAMEEETQVVDY